MNEYELFLLKIEPVNLLFNKVMKTNNEGELLNLIDLELKTITDTDRIRLDSIRILLKELQILMK